MRVSLFDPHPIVHRAMATWLPLHGFSLGSIALTGENAIEQIQQSDSKVVITDVRMFRIDGLKILEKLAESNLKIPSIVFSANINPTYVARAIANGASDYLLKSDPLESLLVRIRQLLLHPDTPGPRSPIFEKVKKELHQKDQRICANRGLTNREAQVIQHLTFGLSNREIARSLGISVETVKEHVQNILRKLNCKDRTEAAVWAVRRTRS